MSAYEEAPKRAAKADKAPMANKSTRPKPIAWKSARGNNESAGAAKSPGVEQSSSSVSGARSAYSDAPYDFGEQVVGSNQEAKFLFPWNLTQQPATATLGCAGEAFELQNGDVTELPCSGSVAGDAMATLVDSAPRIIFRPQMIGRFDGSLTIALKWADGHEEVHVTALHGRARTIDTLPTLPHYGSSQMNTGATSESDDRHAPREDATKESASKDEVCSPANNALLWASMRAQRAAAHLASAQALGVQTVANEAATMSVLTEKVNRSIWWDLAQIGLALGTAGVSSLVAGSVGIAVTRALKDHHSEELVALASKMTSDTIKAGLAMASTRAIATMSAPSNYVAGSHSTNHHYVAGSHSTNQRIDFFIEQKSILLSMEEEYSRWIEELTCSLPTSSGPQVDAAIAALNALTRGFEKARKTAESVQANATSTQWPVLVARASQGTELVERLGPSTQAQEIVNVTSMTAAGKGSGQGMPSSRDGILDIMTHYHDGFPRIMGARLYGVAQEIANRLSFIPLAEIAMPVRLIVAPNSPCTSIITRDEAGRVRVQGDFQAIAKQDGPTATAVSEAEAIHGAELFVQRALSKPLRAVGVSIITNDASGNQ